MARAAGDISLKWVAAQEYAISAYQFMGSEALDEAYVPFFGAFGASWDDAMVAHWSANPLGMLWPEVDAELVTPGGGGGPAAVRRPVVIIAGG